MKPPPFRYHAPASLDEALAVLAEVGDEGKVLAGGQSLVPILNFRLAAPAHLVDINNIPGLGYVRAEPGGGEGGGAGGVRVGATARHADVERDPDAHRVLPLLRQALRLVAHPVIRNRGTTVGSLVHADPAGEMTAVLALVDGQVELARAGSSRTVPAGEFFVGPLESCLQPGELAVAAYFPAFAAVDRATGTEVVEVARRHGDYALCGVAAAVTVDGARRVQRARAAYFGVAGTPVVLDLTEAVAGAGWDGAQWSGADWAGAGRLAQDGLEPEADIHASASYRRHLAGVLTARALRTAADRAVTGPAATGPAAAGPAADEGSGS